MMEKANQRQTKERRKTHSYNQRSRHETKPTCLCKCTRVIPCSIATSSPRFLSILCVSLVWLIPSWLMSQQSWNAAPCVNCFKQLTLRTHTVVPSADMLFFWLMEHHCTLHWDMPHCANNSAWVRIFRTNPKLKQRQSLCPILTCPIGTLIKNPFKEYRFFSLKQPTKFFSMPQLKCLFEFDACAAESSASCHVTRSLVVLLKKNRRYDFDISLERMRSKGKIQDTIIAL